MTNLLKNSTYAQTAKCVIHNGSILFNAISNFNCWFFLPWKFCTLQIRCLGTVGIESVDLSLYFLYIFYSMLCISNGKVENKIYLSLLALCVRTF